MKLCPICFKPLEEGLSLKEFLFEEDIICGNCRHKFIENRRVYQFHNLKIHAFYLYDDFLESLLFQFKEGRDIALEDVFFWKKRKEMNDIFRHRKCIVMPSSEEKIQLRGFFHIQKMLACTNVSLTNCFFKNKNYKQSSQQTKNRDKIHEVMQLIQKPEGEFYLFDDVVTTGNTLLAAAHLLGIQGEEAEAYVYSVHPHFVELCDKEQL